MKKFIAFGLVLLCLTSTVFGGISTWTGTTGSWTEASNWDTVVPLIGDNAKILNGGTAQIGAGDDAVSRYTMIGEDTGNSGTVEISGGSWSTDYPVFVGFDGGVGSVIQTGGDVYIDRPGYGAGETNMHLEIGDRTYAQANAGGTGLWEISGGSLRGDSLNLGDPTSGSGTFRVIGSGASSIVFDDNQDGSWDGRVKKASLILFLIQAESHQ